MKPVPPLFRPPPIALLLIAISIFLHFTFPIMRIIYYPYNLLGIGVIVVGLFIMIWGVKAFQKLETPLIPGEKPKKVVIKGPFTFSRNPMYLGFVIFLLGIAILLGSIIAFISPIGFFLIIHFFFIPFEEKLMEKTFGKKYIEYKKSVRRWI